MIAPKPLFMLALAPLTGLYCMWAGASAAQDAPDWSYIEESRYNTILLERRENIYYLSFSFGRRSWGQTAIDADDPDALLVPYTRRMTLALAYADQVGAIVEIGAASGQTSGYIARAFPDARVTPIDLDRRVREVVLEHVPGLDPGLLEFVYQDGRLFLHQTDARFDVILIDAYRGSFVPFHLLTREFYALTADRLKPGGAMALNIEATTMLFDSTLATLAVVFDHIDLYPMGPNVVVVAYNGPQLSDADLSDRAAALDRDYGLRYPLVDMVGSRIGSVLPSDPSMVLTDDFAPVERLSAIARHNDHQPLGGP